MNTPSGKRRNIPTPPTRRQWRKAHRQRKPVQPIRAKSVGTKELESRLMMEEMKQCLV